MDQNIVLKYDGGTSLFAFEVKFYTYRNRATSRRSRLVAAPLGFQAKMRFLCVFYVVIWTSK